MTNVLNFIAIILIKNAAVVNTVRLKKLIIYKYMLIVKGVIICGQESFPRTPEEKTDN